MTHALTMMADLWAHVGPGLLLAFALPFFLISLGFVAHTGVQQMRERLGAHD